MSASARIQSRLDLALLGLAAVFLWGGLIYKLTTDWSTNSQYEFGYFVPVLIVYLLARRWADRPSPSGQLSTWLLLTLTAFTLFLILPIRLVEEANPDWRPLTWVHAAVVISASLLAIGYAGGWRWIWHFAFPLLLILTAIPWPLAIEQSVIQSLARAVAEVTVELLGWIDIPALQRGNVIALPTGPLGVADACSGVRSLAGTLMASLFFGEYYGLRASRRLALVAGGLAIAFLLNLCRTFFLSWRAASEGIAAVSRWHDSAGYSIFLIAFAALWFLASSICDTEPPEVHENDEMRRRFQPAPMYGIVAWLLLAEFLTQAWYYHRQGRSAAEVAWEPKWPEKSEKFHFVPIPDEARSILRYTDGTSAALQWPDGQTWQVFFFRWDAGRTSAQLAVMHRPEICLPAAGFRYVSAGSRVPVRVGDLQLPFESTVFDSDNGRTYVFRCLWEDHQTDPTRMSSLDMSVMGRLKGAWLGKRNEGQRLLQVGIVGPASETDARQDLKSRLPSLIEEIKKGGGT